MNQPVDDDHTVVKFQFAVINSLPTPQVRSDEDELVDSSLSKTIPLLRMNRIVLSPQSLCTTNTTSWTENLHDYGLQFGRAAPKVGPPIMRHNRAEIATNIDHAERSQILVSGTQNVAG